MALHRCKLPASAVQIETPTVERDGATFTELCIAEGWSAAIVRK